MVNMGKKNRNFFFFSSGGLLRHLGDVNLAPKADQLLQGRGTQLRSPSQGQVSQVRLEIKNVMIFFSSGGRLRHLGDVNLAPKPAGPQVPQNIAPKPPALRFHRTQLRLRQVRLGQVRLGQVSLKQLKMAQIAQNHHHIA